VLPDLRELRRVQSLLLPVMHLLLRVEDLLLGMERRASFQIRQNVLDRQLGAHDFPSNPLGNVSPSPCVAAAPATLRQASMTSL